MKILSVLFVAFAAFSGVFGQTPIPLRPDGYQIGSPAAPVVVDGFFDLLCPDSAAAWPTIKSLLVAYGQKTLQWNMHTFPLPYHTFAFIVNQGLHVVANNAPAAQVWAYTDLLFNNQQNFWNANVPNNSTADIVAALTALVGSNKIMDPTAFANGIANSTLNYETRVSWKYGCSRGVTGTPYFLINGVFVDADPSWQVSDWKSLIDPLLNGVDAAVESPKPVKHFGRHARQPLVSRIVTSAQAPNQTCPPKEVLCNYAPNKYECCLAGENCIPNVGCRCMNSAQC